MTDELSLVEQETALVANIWTLRAAALEIRDADTAQIAADLLVEELAPRRKAVETFFAPLVAAAHAAHKALTSRRAAILARFDEPERIVRAKLAAWRAETEAARAERMATHGDKAVALLHEPEPEHVDGVAFVETWTAEVVDLRELARAVADGRAPETLIVADAKVLNQLAKALKSAFAVPGCRAVRTEAVRRTQ